MGGYIDVPDGEGIEYIDRGRAVKSVVQVVVADEQKDRDTTRCQVGNTLRKLALLGLAGLPAFVGVAAEEHKVNAVIKSVVDQLVERREKVLQTRRKACRGI